jgi:hypothetical protein
MEANTDSQLKVFREPYLKVSVDCKSGIAFFELTYCESSLVKKITLMSNSYVMQELDELGIKPLSHNISPSAYKYYVDIYDCFYFGKKRPDIVWNKVIEILKKHGAR